MPFRLNENGDEDKRKRTDAEQVAGQGAAPMLLDPKTAIASYRLVKYVHGSINMAANTSVFTGFLRRRL